MSILIKNVTVITLDEKGNIYPQTDIFIEGKNIKVLGEVVEELKADNFIDGTNYVAIPAFFNSHTHAAMTLVRGWAEDLPFDRWLNEKIWVAESAMEPDDVYWGEALACCEFIRSGTVGIGDHYFWMNRAVGALRESGMKGTLAWCQFGIGIDNEVGRVSLEDTISFIRENHNSSDGRIKCFLGPHSPYMCPPEFLTSVVEKAEELKVGIHLHVAESQEQVNNLSLIHI